MLPSARDTADPQQIYLFHCCKAEVALKGAVVGGNHVRGGGASVAA